MVAPIFSEPMVIGTLRFTVSAPASAVFRLATSSIALGKEEPPQLVASFQLYAVAVVWLQLKVAAFAFGAVETVMPSSAAATMREAREIKRRRCGMLEDILKRGGNHRGK